MLISQNRFLVPTANYSLLCTYKLVIHTVHTANNVSTYVYVELWRTPIINRHNNIVVVAEERHHSIMY
jgi:hypothetical protein